MRSKKLLICLVFLFVSLFAFGFNAKVNAIETSDLIKVDGAQVRTTGNAGIRFVATETYEGEDSYGILLAFGEAEANDDFVVGGTVNGKTVGDAPIATAESGKFMVTLWDIPEAFYEQKISARAYVKVGEDYVYSSTVTIRSLAEVVEIAYEEGNETEFVKNVYEAVDAKKIKISYNLNGGTTRYTSFSKMSEDFMADYNRVTGKNIPASQLYEAGNVMTDFFADKEMYAKWSWTVKLFNDLAALGYGQHEQAQAQYEAILKGETPSAQWAIRQNMEGLMTMSGAGGYSTAITIDFSLVEIQTKVFAYINEGVELVKYSAAPAELPTPTKPGYVFGGWFDNEELAGEVVTSVAETCGLWAKWSAGTYKVTYVLNNTDANIENTEVVLSALEKYTLVTPTYDLISWQFNGWYLDEEFTTPIMDIAAINEEDVTVYAKWTELTGCLVIYDFGGGNTKYATREAMVDDFLADAMEKYGKTEKPTSMINFATIFGSAMHSLFTDAKYAAKWAWLKAYIIEVSEGGTKTSLESGNESFWRYSVGAFLFKEYRSNWPASADFTNEELANGYINALSEAEQTIYSAQAGEAPLSNVYKLGYTFEGWYETEDFQEGTKVTEITGDCMLYAKWTKNE